MRPLRRARRLVARVVVLSIVLGAAAPGVRACGMAMPDGTTGGHASSHSGMPGMTMEQPAAVPSQTAPCPAHAAGSGAAPAGPVPSPEAPVPPSGTDCCACVGPQAPAPERTVQVPALAALAVFVQPASSLPRSTPLAGVVPPPPLARPGPLYVLHGSLLT